MEDGLHLQLEASSLQQQVSARQVELCAHARTMAGPRTHLHSVPQQRQWSSCSDGLTHTSTINRAASDTLLVLVCVCVYVTQARPVAEGRV